MKSGNLVIFKKCYIHIWFYSNLVIFKSGFIQYEI